MIIPADQKVAIFFCSLCSTPARTSPGDLQSAGNSQVEDMAEIFRKTPEIELVVDVDKASGI